MRRLSLLGLAWRVVAERCVGGGVWGDWATASDAGVDGVCLAVGTAGGVSDGVDGELEDAGGGGRSVGGGDAEAAAAGYGAEV